MGFLPYVLLYTHVHTDFALFMPIEKRKMVDLVGGWQRVPSLFLAWLQISYLFSSCTPVTFKM